MLGMTASSSAPYGSSPFAKEKPLVSVCFAGLGNLASKVIYLSGQPCQGTPAPDRRFLFTHGLLLPNEVTKTNLPFLAENGFFPEGASFFVMGTSEEVRAISALVGSRFNVCPAEEFSSAPASFELGMDFTYDAQPFVQRVPAPVPLVVQSNNYGLGTLWVPPLREARTLRNGERPHVYRAADCSLAGTIPVLTHIRRFFEELFIHFLTDRNVGKGPGAELDTAFYFSDSFGRRKSREFTNLAALPVLASLKSSHVINPFYLADIAGRLKPAAVESHFGSWGKFERGGFFAPLLAGDPMIRISSEDNSSRYRLPPEPVRIRDFAQLYPDFPSSPFIVYFRRTCMRQNNCHLSFTIGFDVNLAAAIANVHLLDAFFSGKV